MIYEIFKLFIVFSFIFIISCESSGMVYDKFGRNREYRDLSTEIDTTKTDIAVTSTNIANASGNIEDSINRLEKSNIELTDTIKGFSGEESSIIEIIQQVRRRKIQSN